MVDSEVTVVNEIAGNLIIQVKESRIALDKTMANRIMIDYRLNSARNAVWESCETGRSPIKTSRGG